VTAMQQIADWLKKLGMSEYAQRFAEERIEIDVLPELTDQDLERLGIPLGHRRRMLRAIRAHGHPVAEGPQIAAPASPAPHDAERRQLTVMFCDLVGSTALSTQLDPEDLRSIIGSCTEVITASDGFVAKYMGDGVLAYFGYPQAHEHDAECAVRAGLALVEVVPKLRTTAAAPLQVRVGIATGLVVVGDLIGTGAAQEQAVVGETPNLASRLQALAEPGAVVIASSTRRLTGGLFEYCDLGTVALKGFTELVPAWQVLGVGTAESRFEALRTTTTPLIGCDEEIGLLLRRWEQAKHGNGCVVLISGEPGIGKSRIAQTVAERISAEPHTRLSYFCSPYHRDTALYPIVAQLERAVGFTRSDTNEQRLTKLENVMAQATDDLGEDVPLLADLLSIPMGEHYPALNIAPQKRKERTLKAVAAQVEGLAARQPVLMVFEDAHWTDPTSREALDVIIGQISRLRLLLIVTYRPEFAPPWVGHPQVTALTLNRLMPLQRAEMIKGVIGGKMLPKAITDQIIDRTDGVPLFIEELTKTVVESGIVIEAGDHYTMKAPVGPLAIPITLHGSLLARLDRLAPIRELAQIGAALGRQFSHELMSAVAELPQHQVNDALAQLVRAELIFQRGTPPDAEYIFKHALVQDAAYGTLLRSRRQQLHRRITATLERQFPEVVEMQPELLARHCTEAGFADKAVGYFLKAGQQAIARCAMIEAVAQLRKGLELLSRVPDSAQHREQELDLQITIGHALIATKGYSAPEPGKSFARARQLCKELNRQHQLGQVLSGQFVFRLNRGELAQAEAHAKEILHLGDVSKDRLWKCFGSFFCGDPCFYLGKLKEARAYYEVALALWDPTFRTIASTPEDGYVAGQMYLSRTLLCLGYIDQAILRRDDAVAEARRLSPYALAWALSNAWYGDWALQGVNAADTMLECAEEVLAISSEHGFPLFLGIGSVMRGWSLVARVTRTEGTVFLV
jgi:class 3 adenylate cyclase/tetratricopeptide (TPR) repeat protein